VDYRRLGSSGLKVSQVCLGAMSFGNKAEWMIEIDKAALIVKRALDLGINFFDTANVYSSGRSEEILGELLKGTRNDVVIATKVRYAIGELPNDQGLSRYHIMREVQRSLKRLQTDHIDLYQIHRWDYDTSIDETLLTLDDLVRSNRVLYIGASSMFAWQFAKALFRSDLLGVSRFISMQNQYSLIYREEEREMIPLCKDQGIALLPWSPLGKGLLTGKYRRDEEPNTIRYKSDKFLQSRIVKSEDFDVIERVQEVAKEKGVRPAQIALAWLFHKGVTAPIIGVTKVEHIEEAVAATEVRLTDDDLETLEEPYKPHPIIDHD
jgi:aryl-alcohol dehydrogenase-like predicted oxidoreductase